MAPPENDLAALRRVGRVAARSPGAFEGRPHSAEERSSCCGGQGGGVKQVLVKAAAEECDCPTVSTAASSDRATSSSGGVVVAGSTYSSGEPPGTQQPCSKLRFGALEAPREPISGCRSLGSVDLHFPPCAAETTTEKNGNTVADDVAGQGVDVALRQADTVVSREGEGTPGSEQELAPSAAEATAPAAAAAAAAAATGSGEPPAPLVSSSSSTSGWARLPTDVMARVHHLTDLRTRRTIRLICSSWRNAFSEFVLELHPKVLYLDRLVSCFPNAECLVLSSTVPEHKPQLGDASSGGSGLAALAQLPLLSRIDLYTSPALLYFGLGIQASPEDILALAALRNLRSLNLTGQCYGTSWGLDVLSVLTGLTDLRVAGEATIMPKESKSLAMLTNLELLDLSERCFARGASLKHLGALKKICCLRLSKCYFATSSSAELRHLAALPALTALDISGWCNMRNVLLNALATLTSLVHLNMSQTPMYDTVVVKLLKMDRLRSLDASYCSDLVGDHLARPFVQANAESLLYLDLCDPRRGSGGFVRLPPSQLGLGGGSALRACHQPPADASLRGPDSIIPLLGNNGADLELLRAAAEAMHDFATPGLRYVSFRGCNRQTRGHMQRCHQHLLHLEHLATTLDQSVRGDMPNPQRLQGFMKLNLLRSLHLDSSVNLDSLCPEALSALCALTSLHIGQCIEINSQTGLGDSNMPQFGLLTDLRSFTVDSCPTFTVQVLCSLAPCTKLRSLHLNTCGEPWVHVNAEAFYELTPTLSRLTDLTLNGLASLTESAVEALTKSCTGLTSLRMSYSSRLRDKSLRFLARLPLLRNLELRNCPRVGNAACAAASVLPSLVFLDLSFCNSIDDRGVALLGASKTLRCITLHNCPGVTSDGFKTLPKWIFVRC